jgi:hypothetical protein
VIAAPLPSAVGRREDLDEALDLDCGALHRQRDLGTGDRSRCVRHSLLQHVDLELRARRLLAGDRDDLPAELVGRRAGSRPGFDRRSEKTPTLASDPNDRL